MLGHLQTKSQANPAMRVLIRADRNVRYEYLKQVMITAGKAGVGKVTFSVVDKDAGNP
jgi:biopolymer transport protein ExbD